jgi:hypothetical protein
MAAASAVNQSRFLHSLNNRSAILHRGWVSPRDHLDVMRTVPVAVVFDADSSAALYRYGLGMKVLAKTVAHDGPSVLQIYCGQCPCGMSLDGADLHIS